MISYPVKMPGPPAIATGLFLFKKAIKSDPQIKNKCSIFSS
jgi:hypothetical protein